MKRSFFGNWKPSTTPPVGTECDNEIILCLSHPAHYTVTGFYDPCGKVFRDRNFKEIPFDTVVAWSNMPDPIRGI